MSIRFSGLVPAIVLLAAGVAQAQPASTGGGGSMAYPDSLPSGQVRVNAPTARDTGSMQTPAPSGGVTVAAPTGRDTGSMQTPTPSGGVTTRPAARGARVPVATTAAAKAMAVQPSTAPVPYTAFAPTPAVATPHGAMRHAPIHHAVVRHPAHRAAAHPAPAATPAATPAPAAPAAPAK